MMPPYFLLVIICKVCQVAAAGRSADITQDGGVITAQVGQNVTLRCIYQNYAATFISWYQQRLGGKPLIIGTRMEYKTEASLFPEFKDRFRVSAEAKEGVNHLMITDLRPSDSATYFCGILEFNALEFGQGTFLHVETSVSNARTVVQQLAMEPLRPGDSVSLSCAAYTEPCAGEQGLYWFRPSAAEPALVYHSAGQCVIDLESDMKNCTLKLAIKSASSSDAGTYYCALASCGKIVFGNGTRLEFLGSTKAPLFLVYCLAVALACSIILLFVLAFILFKYKKRSSTVGEGTISHLSSAAASDPMSQDADILHYAALNLNRPSERHRQEESLLYSVCVYSTVKRKQ